MLRKVTIEKAKEIYKKYIKQDFVRKEIKPYFLFKKYLIKEIDKMYVYEEENKEKGYMICSEENQYVLISHLAVLENYRGTGVGTKLIQNVQEQFPDKKGWIVEVETEKEAKNKDEKEKIQRRIHFYEKLGFCSYKEISYQLFGKFYYVFVLYKMGEKKLTNTQLVEIIQKIYQKKKMPKKFLKIEI